VANVQDAAGKKEGYFGSVRFFKHTIILGSFAIVVTATVFIVLALLRNDAVIDDLDRNLLTGEIVDGRGILVTPGNLEEIIDRLSEPVPDGHYLTTMNLDWVFDTWDTPSRNAFVENATDNVRTVYFDLFLDSTGELIYSSPFMPVGARLEGFALEAPVPAGEHPATVTYHLVDDEFRNLSSLSVMVRLIING